MLPTWCIYEGISTPSVSFSLTSSLTKCQVSSWPSASSQLDEISVRSLRFVESPNICWVKSDTFQWTYSSSSTTSAPFDLSWRGKTCSRRARREISWIIKRHVERPMGRLDPWCGCRSLAPVPVVLVSSWSVLPPSESKPLLHPGWVSSVLAWHIVVLNAEIAWSLSFLDTTLFLSRNFILCKRH